MKDFYSNFEEYKIPVLENGVRLPDFKIDEKHIKKYKLKNDSDYFAFLKCLCDDGLKNRIGLDHKNIKQYQERMKEELDTFNELGFCSYLLITWDIVNYCMENGIATGFARGSAGNSLVLYLIGVTHVDSLKYNLYFERFLNRTRAKFKEIDGVRYYDGSLLMDVDLDIGAADRKKLIDWIDEKYKSRVAKLPTTITFTTKSLIREVCKVFLEMNEERALEISDTVPLLYNIPRSIEESYEENKEFKKFADKNKEAVKIAKRLYELNKYYGVHASAWIITHDDINETIPLRLTKANELCSVYPMDDASDIAIKVDLLGLKCAWLIHDVCKKVGVDPYKIPIDDEKVYGWLQKLESPKGIFQIEGDCNFRVAQQIKPKSLENLAAIVALARPGVLQFVETYAKYLETGEFQSVHPFFDDILKDTAGIPLYQESLLRMANSVGFTLTESETLRRIVGKKKVEEMPKWEKRVRENVKKKGLPKEVGDILWKIMDDSKNYSFNAGHATGYGMASYVTAYLKYYHPKQFFLSLLELTKSEGDTIGEIQDIEQELPRFGIKLLGPDLMKSEMGFSIDGDNIRFGLGYIKGIAEKSFEKLQDFKHEYPNKVSVFCSAKDSGIDIGVLSALIQAGAMDNYISTTRSKAVLEAQLWYILTPREQLRAIEISQSLDYDVLKIVRYLRDKKDDKGKTFISEKRMGTIRKKYEGYKNIFDKNKLNENLASWWYERQLLGYSYSQSLFEIVRRAHPEVISIEETKGAVTNEHVTICGQITGVKYWTAKKTKTKSFRAGIIDSTGSTEALMWSENIERQELRNGGEKFAAGNIVVIEGQMTDDNKVKINRIKRKETEIYMKLKDVKKDKEIC